MRLTSPYRAIAFFLLMLAGLFVFARCADGGHPLPPGQDEPDNKNEIQIEGRVVDFGSNNAGDVDKMNVLYNGKNISIHFPPHTAQAIMATAKPLSVIRATVGERKGPPKKEPGYQLISFTVKNNTVAVGDIPPPPPQRGEEATVAGEVSDVLTDKEGKVRSFVVAQTLIILPPHVGLNLAASLGGANAVVVKGYKRTAGNGFVNNRVRSVIRPVSITVNSITYTIE